MSAWWQVRIRIEAENDRKLEPVGHYLDELLSEDEMLERSSARLAAYFDGLIDQGEATEQ